MKDLGARVAVAIIGIPAVLWLLYSGGWIMGVPLALAAALGTGEVYRFGECRGVRPLSWLGMPATGALVLAAVALPSFAAWAPWALGGIFALTLLALLSTLWARGPKGGPLSAVSVTIFGVLYVGLPVVTIVLLHAMPQRLGWGPIRPSPWEGLMIVVLPLAATWVGDSAAYFAGSAWGRSRLFPSVSPGKTWVGAWAGTLGAAGAGAAWFLAVGPSLPGLPVGTVAEAAGIGALLGIAGILGDLAESLLKREAGMKDSGKIFPGHGGLLDRLDALILTFPLAYGLLCLLEASR